MVWINQIESESHCEESNWVHRSWPRSRNSSLRYSSSVIIYSPKILVPFSSVKHKIRFSEDFLNCSFHQIHFLLHCTLIYTHIKIALLTSSVLEKQGTRKDSNQQWVNTGCYSVLNTPWFREKCVQPETLLHVKGRHHSNNQRLSCLLAKDFHFFFCETLNNVLWRSEFSKSSSDRNRQDPTQTKQASLKHHYSC